MGALTARNDAPAERGTGAESPEGELRAAVALAEVEGLGPRWARRLIDACGSAAAVLAVFRGGGDVELRPDGRARGDRLPPTLRRRVAGVRPVPPERLERLERRGIRVLSYPGDGFPARLAHLYDPPPVLYLQGPLALPARRAVAVVGARRSTEYGRRMARDIAGGLAARGWAVVSGMARGIDAAAHRAALDAGGATVGILGSGLDHEFPEENRDLYAEMRAHGLLVSEFPPAERPRAGYFPRRNRVIAALAEAVVVVQAGGGSGALNTAQHAIDLGREVLAVPGPVGAPGSLGVHGLLRDGAGVAEGAEDVLAALGEGDAGEGEEPETLVGMLPGLSFPDDPDGSALPSAIALVSGLEGGPALPDDLARKSGLPVADALSLLVRLELNGVVRALPGGRYELGRVRRGDEEP